MSLNWKYSSGLWYVKGGQALAERVKHGKRKGFWKAMPYGRAGMSQGCIMTDGSLGAGVFDAENGISWRGYSTGEAAKRAIEDFLSARQEELRAAIKTADGKKQFMVRILRNGDNCDWADVVVESHTEDEAKAFALALVRKSPDQWFDIPPEPTYSVDQSQDVEDVTGQYSTGFERYDN